MTVGFAGRPRAEFRRAQHAVWASLPSSLQPGAAARMLVVDGQAAGWPEVAGAAMTAGVDGLLVVRPAVTRSAARVRRLAAVAAQGSVSVVVQLAWASNPAVAPLAGRTTRARADVLLTDSRITMPGPERPASSALEHLGLVRALLGPVDRVDSVTTGGGGYTAIGRSGTSTVVLSTVCSAAVETQATVAVYAASWEAGISLPDARTAAPAAAFLVEQHGQTQLPTWYETGARASWRRLYDLAAEHATADDLWCLADDLERAAEIRAQVRAQVGAAR